VKTVPQCQTPPNSGGVMPPPTPNMPLYGPCRDSFFQVTERLVWF